MKRTITCIIGITLTLIVGTTNAEPILSEVLNNIYGAANWTPYNAPDELWKCLNGHATAEARFADYIQDFGYLPNIAGGGFQSLFEITATGYLGGSPSALFATSQCGTIFRFADKPSIASNNTNCTVTYLWSSLVSDNIDGMDHMQTYVVTGGPSAGNYVLAWEDLPNLGDVDYQDLVVEVSGVQPVPEPATVLLLGLGALALRKKHKG
jgi:hypothetical protein